MMTKECAQKILIHIVDLEFSEVWVIVREYRRVNGTAADVAAWDTKVRDQWDKYQKASTEQERAKLLAEFETWTTVEEKTFANNISGLLKSPAVTPGLDDSKCVFNWGEFACFCNWAAKQPPGQLVSLANSITSGQKIPYKCDAAISGDPRYEGEWAKPPASAGSAAKTSWWPWALGIGAVVVGGGAVAWYKFGRKHNPITPAAREKLLKEQKRLERRFNALKAKYEAKYGDLWDRRISEDESRELNDMIHENQEIELQLEGRGWPSDAGPRPIHHPPSGRVHRV